MADVVNHLGVSRQLVSLVLRNKPGPSERTRTRVLKAAEELGYRPHLGAQVLRQSRSTRIGVGFIASNDTDSEIVERMYGTAREAGYSLVLSAQNAHRGTTRVLAELRGHRCAGVILIGSTVPDDDFRELARQSVVPVVLVGHGRQNSDYDVVRSAGDVGIAKCVEHLHDLGHRDIAYVDVPSIAPSLDRVRGYERACATLGISQQIARVEAGVAEEEGAGAARALLASSRMPTAIACANDQSALGVAMVLLEAGLRIPQDVSITGFDDSRVAALSVMQLTSARQDPSKMGAKAIDAVLRRINDPSKPARQFVIRPQLVVRNSTAPPGG